MLMTLAIVLLLIALVAYAFGEAHVGAVAIQGAKIVFVIALVLLLLSFLGWPYYRGY